ncbi:hypothetical protein ACV1C5_23005 [Aeromonas caviae]
MDFKCDELILGKTDADSRALTFELFAPVSKLVIDQSLTFAKGVAGAGERPESSQAVICCCQKSARS